MDLAFIVLAADNSAQTFEGRDVTEAFRQGRVSFALYRVCNIDVESVSLEHLRVVTWS